nr:uncharacterized mitochondrial protein AtMg00810-like [Tanacetum cinerariifolium]
IEEWVSDNEEEEVSQPKVEKKKVKSSITEKEFVKFKQQEKTARKTIKQVEQLTQNPHRPRGPDESCVSVNEILFRGMIGSLMYLIASRPDIQFSTCLYARYQANPKESHLIAIKRIFRYLNETLNLGLWYPNGSGFDLKAYFDSDYAGCNLDRKSTSRGCQILRGNLVCWSANKQISIAMSSAKAEYVAAVGCYTQVLWIKSQLADYDVLYENVPIFCDNTSVIAISNNPMLHSRTKHIDIMALTLQPTAMYVEYLKEFWYTAEVKEETKTITFLLSWWDNPSKLSNETKQSLIPPSKEVNADDATNKSLSRASVQPVTWSKAPTNLKTKKKRIPSSFKPKSPHKVLDQNVKEKDAEFVAMDEVAEEQSMEFSTVKQLLDEADKINKAIQETPERFHTADSDDSHKNEVSKSDHIFQNDNASIECLSLPDHMDHIFEEVGSLHSKLEDMKSSIVQQVSAKFKSSLPALATDSLKEQLPSFLLDVQKNLQDQLPNLLLKPMYKEFNAFNKLESQRFVLLQKGLRKFLHQNMKKSIKVKGRSRRKTTLMKKKMLNGLIKLRGSKSHGPTLLKKKTEGTVSVKDHLDDDDLDKKPLSKRFEIITGIPNLIPLNTFVPKHLLKPEEQQKSLNDFTDQLFGTTSSKFSPTPPREPTPLSVTPLFLQI